MVQQIIYRRAVDGSVWRKTPKQAGVDYTSRGMISPTGGPLTNTAEEFIETLAEIGQRTKPPMSVVEIQAALQAGQRISFESKEH